MAITPGPGFIPNQDPNIDLTDYDLDDDGYLKVSLSKSQMEDLQDLYKKNWQNYVDKVTYLTEDENNIGNWAGDSANLSAADRIIKHYIDTKQMGALKTAVERYSGLKFLTVDANFKKVLNTAIMNVTSGNWTANQTAPEGKASGKLVSVLQWLQSQTSGSGGGQEITSEVNYTQKQTAWDLFKSISQDLLNSVPTRDEFEDFYKQLHAKEGKYISSWKDVGSRREKINSSINPEEFTIDYLVKQIDNNTQLKGQAGQAKRALDQLVSNNGLENFISSKTKLKFLKDILMQDKTIEDYQEVIRKQARNVYSQWAPDMDDNPDMSFADIIAPYAKQYQDTLEINGPVDIADVAKTAASGGQKLSAFEYQKALRDDSRWGYTKQANTEAADLAKSFAKAFGVNV
jgi:hypothetical protein